MIVRYYYEHFPTRVVTFEINTTAVRNWEARVHDWLQITRVYSRIGKYTFQTSWTTSCAFADRTAVNIYAFFPTWRPIGKYVIYSARRVSPDNTTYGGFVFANRSVTNIVPMDTRKLILDVPRFGTPEKPFRRFRESRLFCDWQHYRVFVRILFVRASSKFER